MFELEKMAIRFCEQYGIAEDDPQRALTINAFCAGAQIEREACCKAIDAIDDGEAPEYRACQEAIRARSNASLSGLPLGKD